MLTNEERCLPAGRSSLPRWEHIDMSTRALRARHGQKPTAALETLKPERGASVP